MPTARGKRLGKVSRPQGGTSTKVGGPKENQAFEGDAAGFGEMVEHERPKYWTQPIYTGNAARTPEVREEPYGFDRRSSYGSNPDGNHPEPEPVKPLLWTMILVSIHPLINGLFGGMAFGYSSVAFPRLRRDMSKSFMISPTEESWLVSIFPIGNLIGVLLGAPIAEYLNKKWALIAVLIPLSASWVMLAYPTSATMMIIARSLQGVLYGIRISLGQAYVLETTHSKCRGWILSNMSLAIGIGLTLVYIAGALMSWRLVAVTAGIITISLLPLVLFLPSTPLYYLKRGREDEALKSLEWLRGKDYDCKRELNEIKAHIKLADTDFKIRDIFKENKYVAPLALLFFFQIARQGMGYFNVIGHSVQIFEDAGTDHESAFDPFWATVVNGAGDIVAQAVSSMLVETVGRRKPILIASFLIGWFNAAFAIYMYYWTGTAPEDRSPGLITTSTWLPLVAIYGFTFMFCMGMSNVLLVLMGELLPLKIKNFAFSACFGLNTLCQFIVTSTWNQSLATLGYHGIFAIYASFAVVTFFVSVWLLPETRGKTLLEIEILLGRPGVDRRTSLRLKETKSNASTTNPDP